MTTKLTFHGLRHSLFAHCGHRWGTRWRPEVAERTGTLSDALTLSAAQRCSDDSNYLDAEQGISQCEGHPLPHWALFVTAGSNQPPCSTLRSPLSFETTSRPGSASMS